MNTLTREQILSVTAASDFKTIVQPFRRMVALAIGAMPGVSWEVGETEDGSRIGFSYKADAEAWLEEKQSKGLYLECKVFNWEHFPAYESNPAADYRVLEYVKTLGCDEGCYFAVAMDAVWLQRECPHAFLETTGDRWWKYEVGDYSKALLLSRLDGGAT